MAALRCAVPRASFLCHAHQLQHNRLALTANIRHASTLTPPPPPKPRVLEKPDKFRPPSHAARIRQPSRYTGPPLAEKERQAQKTRQYPHMMPPEGTVMHWFLTNRPLHTYISLSILVMLVLGIWFEDFLHNTPYRDLLPPNSMFFAHPITFLWRWAEVYDMHVTYVSEKTAEMRKQKVDDVQKRSEYRKAHGLDKEGSLGGWTAKTEEESIHPTVKLADSEVQKAKTAGVAAGLAPAETYVDFEGKEQKVQKKWFGIW